LIFHTAFLGLVYSLLTTSVWQVFLKWLIGGLRPHFYDICRPNLDGVIGSGWQSMMVTRNICTGDEKEINEALKSFLSGHSAAAFASYVFLALYINSHLKVFAEGRTHYWKLVLFVAPLLGAALISGSVMVDHYHHSSDVVAGSLMGIFMGFISYRSLFSSIWDYRDNHIPLVDEDLIESKQDTTTDVPLPSDNNV